MMTGANARTVPGLSPLLSLAAAGRSAACWNAECQHGEVAQFNLIICIVSSSLRHHLSSIPIPHPGLVTLDISPVNVINAINTVINIIILPAALTSVAVGLVQV